MAYGNANTSSLMSAAKTAQKQKQSLEDSIAAYEWDLSAKTEEDLRKYSEHLMGRYKQYNGVDPARALEYQKKVTSTERSFASAQISRMTTQVLYGNASNRDKYSAISRMFQAAIEAGDENLAQRLESQAARLSITIQNEEIAKANAGAAAAGKAAAAYKKQVTQSITDVNRLKKEAEMRFQAGDISLDEYAMALGDPENGIYAQKNNLLTKAIEDPNLDAGDQNKYVSELSTMYDESNFKKFTGPALKQMAEERPYAIRIDPVTGERTIEKKNVTGAAPSGPGDLKNIFGAPGVDLAKVKKGETQFLDVTRNLQANVGDPQENFQFQVFNSKAPGSALAEAKGGQEFSYYKDPITGQIITYDPTANAQRTPLWKAEQNQKDTERWKQGLKDDAAAGALDTVKMIGSGIGNFMKKNDLARKITSLSAGLGIPASNPLGQGLRFVSSLTGLDKKAKDLEVKVAQKQEAERVARIQENARLAEAQRQATLQQAQRVLPKSAAATVNKNQAVKVAAPFNPMYATKGNPVATVQTYLQSPFKPNNKLPYF